MIMATFTYIPDRPATETSAPRAKAVFLGNYEQRGIQGINPFRDSWDLSFSGRSTADADAILNFFSARNGIEAFEWTTPFNETGQFVASDWQASIDSCNLRTVSAKFELTYLPDKTNVVTPSPSGTTFTWIPDFVANFERKSNAKQAAFGDGYSQRFAIGFNQQSEQWTLEFKNRTNAERDAIRVFLRQMRGQSAFSWTDPITSAVNKFICNEWSTTFDNHNNNTISATFQRRFES